jgi:hypothetical protein
VLGFARPALQRRAKMPVGRVKKANHSDSRRQAVGRGQGPRLGASGLRTNNSPFFSDPTAKDELRIGASRQFCGEIIETKTCQLLLYMGRC